MNPVFLYRALYERLGRPLLFGSTPQRAHERVIGALRWLDDHPRTWHLLDDVRRRTLPDQPVEVAGVKLSHPLILAAGLVKGRGFASEDEAQAAIAGGEDIIPGWRSLPLLVGAVEFGSFTRWPRLGNAGTVLWRDEPSHSTQNRVGLKNPGACAAAEFLARHRADLPDVLGINIAASPGVDDPEQEKGEIREALAAFLNRAMRPAWFTLNLSCPNTEDDPGSRQTESRAQHLCRAVADQLSASGVPLWVKISPGLSAGQYQALMRVFAETGVRAVIATNTYAEPVPMNSESSGQGSEQDSFLPLSISGAAGEGVGGWGLPLVAGVGGGRLRSHALAAVGILTDEKRRCGYPVEVIACGGVQDGASYQAYARLGVKAMQYWTALVYRGPLAAAVILREVEG